MHEDRDRLTATAVVGETRIRAILTPTEGLIAKNPTTPFDPGAVDPVAAMKKAARFAREREQSATPVVRLVWIGGSAGAMQLVNVCTCTSRRSYRRSRARREVSRARQDGYA